MRLRDHVLIVSPVGAAGASLVLAVFFGVGCVSLDKPEVVEKCATTAGGCQNGPSAPDAKDDAADVVQPDLWPADDPAGTSEDLAPDVGSDAGIDMADSSIEKKDTTGAEPAAEAPPSDLRRDRGAEAGSDQGLDVGVDRRPDEGVEAGDAGKADVIRIDVDKVDVPKDDVTGVDVGGPEAPLDIGNADVPNTACPAVNSVSGTNGNGSIVFNTTGPVCFVTCDDIQYGWGCDNFSEANRTVKVNGTSVKCGGTLPPKKSPGNYYYFQFGAGVNTWDAIHWSGTNNATCPPPAGGFVP
jgi:hypothetical protein